MTFRKIARIFLPLVCLIGFGFALTSLINHTKLMYGLSTGPSFCNISAHINCDAVSRSQFSLLLGLPLETYAIAFYLGIFLLCVATFAKRLIPEQGFFDAVLVLGTLATLAAVVLFLISQFFIGALCVLCLGMDFANLSILAIALAVGGGPVGTRFRSGLLGLLSVPRSFFRGNSGSPQRILTLLVLLLSVCSIFLPRLLYVVLKDRGPSAAKMEEVVQFAINDWRSQVPVQPSVDEQQGPYRDYSKGSPFAPIQVVEFSDYQCPACRNLYFPLEELLAEYAEKVHFVFRNYPLDRACNPEMDRDMHQNACFAANFARCAGEQGKFWEVSDYIFRLDELDGEYPPERVQSAIRGIAQIFRLDSAAIDQCMSSGRQLEKIRKDIAEGSRLGLTGTPSVWVNGKKVRVANPAMLRGIFKAALSPEGAGSPAP